MTTMKDSNINPHIRVFEDTRKRLKVMAAQHEMTMQELVEWLLAEQEKREKEEHDDANKNV